MNLTRIWTKLFAYHISAVFILDQDFVVTYVLSKRWYLEWCHPIVITASSTVALWHYSGDVSLIAYVHPNPRCHFVWFCPPKIRSMKSSIISIINTAIESLIWWCLDVPIWNVTVFHTKISIAHWKEDEWFWLKQNRLKYLEILVVPKTSKYHTEHKTSSVTFQWSLN